MFEPPARPPEVDASGEGRDVTTPFIGLSITPGISPASDRGSLGGLTRVSSPWCRFEPLVSAVKTFESWDGTFGPKRVLERRNGNC